MSVPRPAMLVETVTAPRWPARETISASCSWNLALSTVCGILARLSMRARVSEDSTEAVPTEAGLALGVGFLDRGDDGVELLAAGLEDLVVFIHTDVRRVGRDGQHVEPVDVVELGGLGLGGAGHAREFLIEAEVVLDGDGGEGLGFLLDGDAFLGLDGLVQSVRPAAAGHFAAGVFIDDETLPSLTTYCTSFSKTQ